MYLRFEGLEYIDADIMDFKEILSRIYGREDADGAHARALQFQLGGVRRHMSWREFILGISSAGDFLGTTSSYTSIRDLMLRLCHKMIAYSIARRSQAPETEICFREEAGGHDSWSLGIRDVGSKLSCGWGCSCSYVGVRLFPAPVQALSLPPPDSGLQLGLLGHIGLGIGPHCKEIDKVGEVSII
ncbi:hypothetical protein Tco_1303446 [Tanacetum coccineum]